VETRHLSNTHGGLHNNNGTPLRKNSCRSRLYIRPRLEMLSYLPKPFTHSWLLNEDTCLWEAPVAYATR
jgi:hypothetical protein